MALDPDRRSALLASRLRTLAQSHWAVAEEARGGAFPEGASLSDGERCWVLVEEGAERRLGGALAVARRAGVSELHLIVTDERAGAVVARRASTFAVPPQVWWAQGRELTAVVPAPAAADPAPAPEAELYRPLLRGAGLDPVVEGGNLVGELLGLEVARVVVADDGSAHAEAGVGRFDREVGAMMFAELGEADALTRAVDIVARYRTPGAARHPLNQLVLERWLRAVVIAHPSVVGAGELRAVGSAQPRRNLTEEGVATAVGVDETGVEVVVCCSTGVYLDLVPTAADDRLTHAPGARLVLAVPERDAVAVTVDLASQLASPAEVVAVTGDWQHLGEAG